MDTVWPVLEAVQKSCRHQFYRLGDELVDELVLNAAIRLAKVRAGDSDKCNVPVGKSYLFVAARFEILSHCRSLKGRSKHVDVETPKGSSDLSSIDRAKLVAVNTDLDSRLDLQRSLATMSKSDVDMLVAWASGYTCEQLPGAKHQRYIGQRMLQHGLTELREAMGVTANV